MVDVDVNYLALFLRHSVCLTICLRIQLYKTLFRSEALGISQERTMTTKWHSTFNMRVRITKFGRETASNCDAEERLLS